MKRVWFYLMAITLMASFVLIVNSLRSGAEESHLPVFDTLGGDFSMPSTLGHQLALSDLRGKVVLLNFGFTSCPDVCPTVLSRMRSVLTQSDLSAEQLQLVFVTVDPERDELTELKTYLSYFHPSIIGMRGDEAQLTQASKLFKMYIEKQTSDKQENYDFVHSDRIYLIDQLGQVRATYANSVLPAQMIDEIKTLIN